MKSSQQILQEAGIQARRFEEPGSIEEVVRLVELARKDKMRLLPLGGGTSLAVGEVPQEVDLVMDMRGLRSLEVDPRNLNIIVEAGRTVSSLNEELACVEQGFMFPLDPPRPQEATLGGSYAANMSGPLRQLYGSMRDMVLGVWGVTAEGKEVGFGGVTVKNVSGYDIPKFLIGSGGTLMVITKIALRIFPIPQASALCTLHFAGGSKPQDFLAEIRGSVLLPSAVVATCLSGDVGIKFLIALEGHPKAVERQKRDILEMASRYGAQGSVQEGRGPMLEALRSSVEPQGPASDTLTLKVSVPISKGLEAVESLRALAEGGKVCYGVTLLGGNGVIFFSARDPSPEVLRELAKGARDVSLRLGGHAVPVSGPHPVVSAWGPRMDSILLRKVVRPIKELWDPFGVFVPIGLPGLQGSKGASS